jgi:hypothetical protein
VGKGYQRPWREDPGIHARNRKAGTVPFTEGEIDARIMASAADLAATDGVERHTPPFLDELVSTFWHRLFRSPELQAPQLAASLEGARMAEARQGLAEARRRGHEGRSRELRSERKRMAKPFTGMTLTRPEALLLCVVPGFVIEVLGSAPSLDAAFELGKYFSWAFAAAISAILILAAEQMGNTLASTAGRSRARASALAATLLVIAVGAGVWAVVTLAESRATNLAYQHGGELDTSTVSADGGFGAAEPGQGAGAGSGAEEPAAAPAPTSPDYGFFIPLSVMIMATAMLFAYRIELAHDWNELARAVDEAEGDVDGAQEEVDEAIVERNRQITPENEAVMGAAAVIEREQGLLTLWIARYLAEYHRFCAALGRRPQELTEPHVPETEEVLFRVTEPQGPRRPPGTRRPREGAGPSNGSGPAPGGSGNGGDPGTPRPEPEPPPPFSQSPPGNNGNSRSRDDGSPQGFGSSG